MKPRARRVTVAAAVLGLTVVAALLVLNWGRVRDHVEAWHFQLTKETETIEHEAGREAGRLERVPLEGIDWKLVGDWKLMGRRSPMKVKELLGVVAEDSGCPVIVESKSAFALALCVIMPPHAKGTGAALAALRTEGWRIVEQRFPRRAYVLCWVCPHRMQAALQR